MIKVKDTDPTNDGPLNQFYNMRMIWMTTQQDRGALICKEIYAEPTYLQRKRSALRCAPS
jgi:hypothetical protein